MARKQLDITAIIYDKRGRILSIGKNSYVKTHPMQARLASKMGKPKKVFLHAELAAIIRCRDASKAHRIDVIRCMSNGSLEFILPCPICREGIRESGINVINGESYD